jgi:formylglycine-generating enzyme required for sulfatase activity/serine/threonine protein kinase
MSEAVENTRGQSPDDVRRATPPRTFEAGEPVPGLSSWVLERKLGGGGFGEVWLARHAWDADQKPRAVKFCTDPAARHRLVTHEKNVVVRVMKYAPKHPNIVPLLDCNLDGDVPWLMYEFVEGDTLAAHIAQWRDLPLGKRLGRAVRALHAVAGALATCHRLDPPLVHRDMKPANVLMAGAVPRVTDFGIGGIALPDADSATGGLTAMAARLPSVLQTAGTRMYAPPEQMYGSPPSPRDDVYALGVIAYQLLLGDLKTGPGADAADELRDLKIPAELHELIVRSVAMNPDRRPKDATEWERALAALIEKAKTPEPTDATGFASKPVLLPDAPPTASPIPPPLPKAEPLSEMSKPVLIGAGDPLPHTAPAPRRPKPLPRPEPEPEPRKRRTLLVVVGSVLALGLLAGVVIALLPSGPRPEPTQPTAQNGPKVGNKGTTPDHNPKGGVTPKKGTPEPKTELDSKVAAPNAGDTREVEIARGTKMTLCWIPKGECQLGSPKTERITVMKLKGEKTELGWALLESEERRGKFKTDGFWMGKYEVTQSQWTAVMGSNPSEFDGKNENMMKGMDTSRLPVERVNWNMICEQGGFLEKVNTYGGVQVAFGKASQFRLPHEDEWEYACRGGFGNTRAFHFGNKLNGAEANCNGELPYGSVAKGANRKRSTSVGTYSAHVHPWGLCDMHGNVWEWCANMYGNTNNPVQRGGSWFDAAHVCRTAGRYSNTRDNASSNVGFRVCLRID